MAEGSGRTMPSRDAAVLERAVQRIAAYAAGMAEHCEQQGFGEARSWRVVLHEAQQVLGQQSPADAPTTQPKERQPSNDELERLIKRSRFVRGGDGDLALQQADAHDLLGRLADELLLWRHSHPGDLPN